jgi:hypothetical protein
VLSTGRRSQAVGHLLLDGKRHPLRSVLTLGNIDHQATRHRIGQVGRHLGDAARKQLIQINIHRIGFDQGERRPVRRILGEGGEARFEVFHHRRVFFDAGNRFGPGNNPFGERTQTGADLEHGFIRLDLGGIGNNIENVGVDQIVLPQPLVRAVPQLLKQRPHLFRARQSRFFTHHITFPSQRRKDR